MRTDHYRYDALRLRAHKYYHTRLQHADETVRHDALTDLLFLHRHHDVLNPLLGQASGAMVPEAERAARSDHARIVQLIQNLEGPASARVAARWLALHPEGAARKNRSLNFSTSLSAHTGVICGRALTRWPSY